MNKPNPESFNKSKYNLATLLIFVLIGAVALAAVIAYYGNKPAPLNYEIIAERKAKLADVNAKQSEIISSYAWVDKAKGVVRIPVERAMNITIEEFSKEAHQESKNNFNTNDVTTNGVTNSNNNENLNANANP